MLTIHNRPRIRENKIEQLTRGAFDRSSNRFNSLIELDLATRPFTAFEVIYHTSIIRPRASI
jgi:hypothetical protein